MNEHLFRDMVLFIAIPFIAPVYVLVAWLGDYRA